MFLQGILKDRILLKKKTKLLTSHGKTRNNDCMQNKIFCEGIIGCIFIEIEIIDEEDISKILIKAVGNQVS